MKATAAGFSLALAVATVVSAVGVTTRADSASPAIRQAGGARVPGDRTPPAPLPIVVSQVPLGALPGDALADGTLRRLPGEGGRLVVVDARGRARVLTPGFESASDPDVSFDGQRVLFAGRQKKGDPWCAWEMKVDGTALKRITCGTAGLRQPIYQPTIYTITTTNVEPWVQIAFVGENPGERNEAGVAANTSLWSCKTDGTALRRLTHNLSNDMDPVVLPDGRMIYAGWLRHPTSRGAHGRVGLLGVNTDGTDYQTYAGDQGLRVKQSPTATADGWVVFVEADRIAGDGAGRLAAVAQHRPLHTYRSLTGEDDGHYRAPAGLPDGGVLVAWRPGATGRFGVYRLEPSTGGRVLLHDDPRWHTIQAKPVVARTEPDARSSVVQDTDATGTLFTIDVGINDLGPRWPRGAAKTVRVVEGVPAGADRPAGAKVLGEFPLANDGSYQVKVPANLPVQLQLLDGDGLALRTSPWLWVRNHAAQGCVGCHEDPERTPPNRLMEALAQPAPDFSAPAARPRTITSADVGEIVASKCVSCHRGGGSAPDLEGGLTALSSYVTPGEARRSPLIWHLMGRVTARPWDPEHAGATTKPQPAGAPSLTAPEIRAFAEWIDLGGRP